MSRVEEKSNPIPQGKYVPATRFENRIYTAGMTPRKDGTLIKTGKVSLTDAIESYREAVRQAAKNALTAATNKLNADEQITHVLSMNVYVYAEEGFKSHAQLADIASEYMYEQIGEAGIGSRAAIGVASLPGNAPVEIQLVVGVSDTQPTIGTLRYSSFA